MSQVFLPLHKPEFVAGELEQRCRQAISSSTTPLWQKDLFRFIHQWLKAEKHLSINTSGSTGPPRSMQVSKQAMVRSARITQSVFGLRLGQTALLCLPVNYIAGKMMAVRALVSGLGLLAIEPKLNIELSFPSPIDFAALIPAQLARVIDSGKIDMFRRIIVGGGVVSPSLREQLQQVKVPVTETYGMTETLSHVATRELNGTSGSPVFKALSSVTFSLDKRGCLVVHASEVASSPVVTNDMVILHDNRSFTLKGRIDFVINSGGKKLFPEELEQKAGQFFKGRRFMFAGKPDNLLGEKVVVIVEGAPIDLDGQMLQSVLQKHELPKEILFCPEFQETTTGKINRWKVMQAMFQV